MNMSSFKLRTVYNIQHLKYTVFRNFSNSTRELNFNLINALYNNY